MIFCALALAAMSKVGLVVVVVKKRGVFTRARVCLSGFAYRDAVMVRMVGGCLGRW